MKLGSLLKNKIVRTVLIALAALLLLILAWVVFAPKSEGAYAPTERESRLKTLLEELDEVERATVMITEEEGTAVSAVIIFEGEDGILLRTQLLKIAANALSLPTKDILVYPAR